MIRGCNLAPVYHSWHRFLSQSKLLRIWGCNSKVFDSFFLPWVREILAEDMRLQHIVKCMFSCENCQRATCRGYEAATRTESILVFSKNVKERLAEDMRLQLLSIMFFQSDISIVKKQIADDTRLQLLFLWVRWLFLSRVKEQIADDTRLQKMYMIHHNRLCRRSPAWHWPAPTAPQRKENAWISKADRY